MTLIIAPQTVECEGIDIQECLQVKESRTANWEYFYDHIGGFNYEPGYEYVLKVKTEEIENPPADGSSTRVILQEQVSKTKM